MYNETWIPLKKEVISGAPGIQEHPLAKPFPGVVVGMVKLLISVSFCVLNSPFCLPGYKTIGGRAGLHWHLCELTALHPSVLTGHSISPSSPVEPLGKAAL